MNRDEGTEIEAGCKATPCNQPELIAALVTNVRGTGLTIEAMLSAPEHAVYVWCNRHIDYPKHLAVKHNRRDLQIVPPQWIIDRRYVGLKLYGVVIDPAIRDIEMPLSFWSGLDAALGRVCT